MVGPLQEGEDGYYATAVIEKGQDQLKVATVAWLKQPFESWQAEAEPQVRTAAATSAANYTLPADPECLDDTWTATSTVNLSARYNHTAVWTGSEMIVWGGNSYPFFPNRVFASGGRYDPATDTWTRTHTTNTQARSQHTAVWTGSEMIVWGGSGLNTGGRYNPSTNSWQATRTTNAPEPRAYPTAVWTGSEMIVWGGFNVGGTLNTGGRYNPSTNRWEATSITAAVEAVAGRDALRVTRFARKAPPENLTRFARKETTRLIAYFRLTCFLLDFRSAR